MTLCCRGLISNPTTTVSQTAFEQNQDGTAIPSWSCSKAVYNPVWHTQLLCVQWITPDDGQRNCPKHVEFHSTNKFEKLVHLVCFIIRIRHDARSHKRKIRIQWHIMVPTYGQVLIKGSCFFRISAFDLITFWEKSVTITHVIFIQDKPAFILDPDTRFDVFSTSNFGKFRHSTQIRPYSPFSKHLFLNYLTTAC
jgi:hypothetical protein